jgi:hypothetical protein
MENEEAKAGGPEESKADRFKRLAEPRVSNAIRRIELIGNLGGSSYEFTAEQVEKILASLRAAVDEVEKKFQKGLNKKGYNDHGRFRL